MRYLSIIIGLAASLVLSGCVTPQNTGPVTTYITKAVPLEKVKSEIIQVYTGGGWNMERESDHMITFVIENKNPMAQLFMSSQYDSRVFNRETVIITDSDQGVSISATQTAVTNYGSAFEHSTPVASGGQARLDEIGSYLMR
jgi:hypothetical protein